MAVKNWLSNSYKTHGQSTEGDARGNRKNNLDGRAKQTADIDKPKTAGNKSGGGKSSIRDGGAPADGKTRYAKGLMRGNNRGG
ncbi:MAG: hypothetical protein VB131_00760 [Burkholderia gladioli]